MSDLSKVTPNLPPDQAAISAKCFHLTGNFVEFEKEEIEQSVPSRFEKIVAKYPDRVAVKTRNHQLIYDELNSTANRVARSILDEGGEKQGQIALLLEHDAPMIAAILGVLKAGKIYVPLDPLHPLSRTTYILQDSQADLMVTNNKNLALAKRLVQDAIPLINIDNLPTSLVTKNLGLLVSSDALAYILYTSGSTGRPKGVVQNHRNILHDIKQYTNTLHICPEERITLLYSYSVNGAVRGIFGALLNGAALYPLDIREEGTANLANYLIQEEITFYHSVPTVFRNFITGLTGKEEFPRLRLIRFGGERVLTQDVESYKKHFSENCILYTGMGATEHGHIRQYFLDKQSQITGSVVPTGYPVEDKEVLLLDESGTKIGFNRAGEIAVRSRYLSPGYWQKPDLTQTKFLRDSGSEDRRIYLTGDLGQMRPDGCLEHLGRKDFQVKIRGYRIEVAEIEMALLDYPGINEAIVMSREDRHHDPCLVAYLVPADQPGPSTSELRNFLKSRLPDYMIPAVFVILIAMPVTPNGKVDRRALPAPDGGRPRLDGDFVEPRTATEKELADLWAQMLGVEQVGINDNFFDLGGHSLLATQMISRLRDSFRVELPLLTLFENPTVTTLAKIIEHKEREESVCLPGIRPVSREGTLPLSFSQERVWFIQQLNPTNRAYHVQSTLRFTGRLDVAALRKSLSEIVRRHEIFRTTFPAVDGQPVQVIHKAYPVDLPVVDIQAFPENEREAQVQRLITEEKPFDLTQLPLIRCTLLRLNPQEHVLNYVVHHMVHDGWSLNVFLRELLALYKAFVSGEPSSLPELPLQFVDLAHWQRQWMEGAVAETQLAYWKKKLAGGSSLLKLPFDHPRPKVQSLKGDVVRMELPLNLCESLRVVSRQEGVTLFMTMLAAFLTLLHRYTQQDDICVGSGIANRRWRETEGLIGMMMNTITLRADLSANPTFRELLGRVRKVALEAYTHQDLPFGKIVEALQPERSLSYSPLYQVTFTFSDAPRPELELPGVTLELREVLNNESAKFDLNVVAIPRSEQHVGMGLKTGDDGITMIWEYSADLFDGGTIARMASHYQTLLEGIVGDCERRLSDFPILTRNERHSLLVEWNETNGGCLRDKCIHELFEAQVERAPDAVAVVFENKQLTYRELNAQVNQLAHYLLRLSIGPEVLVGICVERSLEMIVGILGTLKAGAAYVPLDPTYPKARLTSMLEDTQAPVVLTQQRLIENLPKNGAQLVCLDCDWEVIAAEKEDNLDNVTTADNLAYVIYTSGSTGKPKGVGVPHRGVTRLVKETNYVELTEKEVFLQFAPLSFDASTFEIWACLLNGAKLVVFPPYTPSLKELGEALEQSQVTTLWLTSALFHSMVENHIENLRSVKQLLAGGDVLTASDVKRVLKELPGCRLINGYGPTENTTFTCCYQMTSAEQVCDSVSIGRPIANTQVYILDHHLNPVPIVVTGELYIGGDGLARGYFKNPDPTAEKFIPHPFIDEPGARLYKTGDLARYLPDCNIEFLGRIDYQVKIRGFRIELGEIESTLNQHPAVRESVVLAREDSGDKRLAAYIVSNQQPAPLTNDLRSFLKQKLPDYMLPSVYVFLDSLPLTSNGKIDRRALPTPDQTRLDLEESFVAPRTQVEEGLAKIWGEVLKLDRVGIYDNFFDLGGHSLKATQVMSRLREVFQVEMPLRNLFEHPTVAGLAESLEAIRSASNQPRRLDVNTTTARETGEI